MPIARLRTPAAVFVLLSVILLPVRAPAAAAEQGPPRYDLPVGRVLTYSQASTSKRPDGTAGTDTRSAVRATVVAANPDGLRRVVIRSALTYGDNPEEVSVGAFDVFPDGRAAPVGRPNPDVSARGAFPPLPPDAAAATWAAPVEWNGTVTTYTAAPAQAGDEFVFTSSDEGLIRRLYDVTHKATVRFDRRRGVVAGRESETTQGYGFKQTITGRMTLDGDERIDPARAAALGAAYEKLLRAEAAYGEALARVYEEPADAARLIAEAGKVWPAAMAGAGELEVLKEFEAKVKRHEQNAEDLAEEAKRIAGVLNKPVAAWEATDLDGKPWSGEGLKGKVVVMDFWYRGCGWCMFAMPQVKQLAADYQGKPVVVLGMNTDRKEEDARFVVKELELTYPQIKAQGLPERFAVQGFPTLLVIDQAGTVRGFHVGYSHDLRERVGRRIDELLRKAPAPAHAGEHSGG